MRTTGARGANASPEDAPARPRVALVGPAPGGYGGIAVAVELLLASPFADRYRPVVVATHREGSRRRKLLAAVGGLARLAGLLASRRLSVVLLHASSGPSFRRKAGAAMLARLARVPYVVHVHAGDFEAYLDRAPAWERALARTTLRRADRVVALSQTQARALEPRLGRTLAIVPNPVRIPAVAAAPASAEPTVVSVGRLGAGKGSAALVEALAALGGGHASTRLVLAGDGELDGIRALAERLGVADRVDVPGWIGADERDRLLREAAVFALPSREEAMPLSLLEAMAAGLPVVVTPVGSIPELVEHGRHGFLVPPDDPARLAERLAQLLEDRRLAARMGEEARRSVAARYSDAVVGSLLADLVDDVLAERGRPRRDGT